MTKRLPPEETKNLELWCNAARSSVNFDLARSVATRALSHADPDVRKHARALLKSLQGH